MDGKKPDLSEVMSSLIKGGKSVIFRRLRGEPVTVDRHSLQDAQAEIVDESRDAVTGERLNALLISELRERLNDEELRLLKGDSFHAYQSHPNPFPEKSVRQAESLDALRRACMAFAPGEITGDQRIGQLLLGAMVWDGVASRSVLEALYRQRTERLFRLPDHSFYLDLRMAHEGGTRVAIWRWRPSIVTAVLFMRQFPEREETDTRLIADQKESLDGDSAPSNQTLKTDWQKIRACVGSYVRLSMPDGGPVEPVDILAGVGVWLAGDGCELVRQYASREVIGHVVKERAMRRLHGVDPRTKENSDEIIGGDVAARQVPEAPEDVSQAILPSDLIAFRRIFNSNSKREVLSRISQEKCSGQIDDLSVLRVMIDFSEYLLNRYQPSGKSYAVATIRRYAEWVVGLFRSASVFEQFAYQDQETYGEIYESIIESMECPRRRDEIARLLVTFHGFLVETYKVCRIDFTADGEWASSLNPVDSNIVSVDEYERALEFLGKDPGLLKNPAAFASSKILLILAFRCGMRRMEILGLRIGDVHLSYKTSIRVIENEYRRLKSPASRRQVPVWLLLSKDEQEFLLWWVQERRQISGGNLQDRLLIFRDRDKKPPDGDDLMPGVIDAIRRSTGDSAVRFHGLRHSFATWLFYALNYHQGKNHDRRFSHLPKTSEWLCRANDIRKGLLENTGPDSRSAWAVMCALGHASPTTSLGHYIHAVDWLHADCVARVGGSTQIELSKISGLSIKQIENARYRKGDWQIPEMVAKQNSGRIAILKPAATHPADNPRVHEHLTYLSSERRFLDLCVKIKDETIAAEISTISEARAKRILEVRSLLSARLAKDKNAISLHGVLLSPKNRTDADIIDLYVRRSIKALSSDRLLLTKVLATYFRYRRQDASLVFTRPDQSHRVAVLIDFLRDIGLSAEDLNLSRQKGSGRSGVKERWKRVLPIVGRVALKERALSSSESAAVKGNWLGMYPVLRVEGRVSTNRAFHYLMELLYLRYELGKNDGDDSG